MMGVVQQVEKSQMNSVASEELTLAQRAGAGDESALRALYDHHADPLYAFICHACNGARSEAQEIWQDTLETAFRTLGAFRGQSEFFTWLCGIARHKLADHWRRQNRPGQQVLLLPPEELAGLMDGGPLPQEILNRRDVCLRVVEVLGRLPAEYRSALVARYADGCSVEETAKLLDKTYKATESVLSRAKAALRKALGSKSETEL